MKARVSVVMPAFNVEAFIGEAIASVIAQEAFDLEVIVVDDGSSDGTAAVAEETGCCVVLRHEANRGISAARNSGVQRARGGFLAFLDADDLWPPGSIAARLRRLDDAPALDGVFGGVVQFGEGREDAMFGPGYVAGSMLIRRTAFDRVGNFDEALVVGEFIDWYARAREAGLLFDTVPEVVLHRRIHTTNTGIVRRDDSVDYARVLRRALARRRSAAE